MFEEVDKVNVSGGSVNIERQISEALRQITADAKHIATTFRAQCIAAGMTEAELDRGFEEEEEENGNQNKIAIR